MHIVHRQSINMERNSTTDNLKTTGRISSELLGFVKVLILKDGRGSDV